jgi:nucleotide-binding universal stress UspA family protein
MIKTILVGLGDLTYSKSATHFGLQLAQAHGAELTAVTLVDVQRLESTGPVPIGGGRAAKELREYRLKLTQEIVEEAVQHFEQSCHDAGVGFRLLREEGDPFARMVDCARYHDIVVCGLKSLFEHGVIDEPPRELIELIAGGVRPILAVTPQQRTIERVLIAYSGSPESAKTMKRFVQMRIWPNLAMRIVTFGDNEDEANRLLENAAKYCRHHGFQPETEYVAGHPMGQVLPYAAQWNADLIVMGSSARNFLLRNLIGETASHVVSHADRPLFLCQ